MIGVQSLAMSKGELLAAVVQQILIVYETDGSGRDELQLATSFFCSPVIGEFSGKENPDGKWKNDFWMKWVDNRSGCNQYIDYFCNIFVNMFYLHLE